MGRRKHIVNCATVTFYQELAKKIVKHKRRTPLQGQIRLNERKPSRQDMNKVKAVELQIAVKHGLPLCDTYS
jgi:hypothetical protein